MSRHTLLVALAFLGPGDVISARMVCKSWNKDCAQLRAAYEATAKRVISESAVLTAVSRMVSLSKRKAFFNSFFWAGYYGSPEVVEWLVSQETSTPPAMIASVMTGASCGGHVNVLKCLALPPSAIWKFAGAIIPAAVAGDALPVLEWWRGQVADHSLEYQTVYNAMRDATLLGCRLGRLECVKWLAANGAIFDATSCQTAANTAQLEVLVWLEDVCSREHYICGKHISSLRAQAKDILDQEGASRKQYSCVLGMWNAETKTASPACFVPVIVEKDSAEEEGKVTEDKVKEGKVRVKEGRVKEEEPTGL